MSEREEEREGGKEGEREINVHSVLHCIDKLTHNYVVWDIYKYTVCGLFACTHTRV